MYFILQSVVRSSSNGHRFGVDAEMESSKNTLNIFTTRCQLEMLKAYQITKFQDHE